MNRATEPRALKKSKILLGIIFDGLVRSHAAKIVIADMIDIDAIPSDEINDMALLLLLFLE